MVRHGARAPLVADPGYTVAAGMLTPSGMRQRHLLGKDSHQKYIERQGLLDKTYNPNQFLI